MRDNTDLKLTKHFDKDHESSQSKNEKNKIKNKRSRFIRQTHSAPSEQGHIQLDQRPLLCTRELNPGQDQNPGLGLVHTKSDAKPYVCECK